MYCNSFYMIRVFYQVTNDDGLFVATTNQPTHQPTNQSTTGTNCRLVDIGWSVEHCDGLHSRSFTDLASSAKIGGSLGEMSLQRCDVTCHPWPSIMKMKTQTKTKSN